MGSSHLYCCKDRVVAPRPILGFPCELRVNLWSQRVLREDAVDIFGTSVCHHTQSDVISLPMVVFSYFEGVGKKSAHTVSLACREHVLPHLLAQVPNLPLPTRENTGSSLQLSHKLPSGLLYVGLCSGSGQITLQPQR